MAIAVFCSLLAFSVIMGVMHCLTDYSNDWKSVSSKTFFVLSTVMLALANANFSSSYGALTLMISFGLAMVMASQTLQCTNAQQQTRATFYMTRIIQSLSLLFVEQASRRFYILVHFFLLGK